jgi:hypothetical protein
MMDQSPSAGGGEGIRPGTPGKRRRVQVVSPLGLLALAALVAAAYGVVHALGWREHVSVVFATSGGGGGQMVMGLLYVAGYFGFVLLVPVLVPAAGVFALLSRLLARRA